MIKYYAMYDNEIRPMEILKDTTHFFTATDGRRFKKHSDYGVLFDSFEAAKEFLLKRLNLSIEQKEAALAKLKADRYQITLLEPPE